jgi:DNA-binding beta-propeller fold protein YncE
MSPKTYFFLFLLLWVLTFFLTPLNAGTPGSLEPVALWPAAGGGLYVLDHSRGLIYIPTVPGLDLKASSKFASFSDSWQTVDMTAVRVGSEDRVYVILAQETTGMLLCYANRQFVHSWIAKTILSGIAPDPQGQRLFLSGGLTNQIYEFVWNDPNATPTKVFIAVHGSQLLGPLAFDPESHLLYAGDERIGVIFAIDVNTKSVSRVGQIAGQPSALAFDSIHRTLYVVDSVGRKVWAFQVGGKAVKPQLFSSSPDFRQPTAIAVDANGTVWLGDPASQAIYQLGPKGSATPFRLAP